MEHSAAVVVAVRPIYFPAATFHEESAPFGWDTTLRPGCCPGPEFLCGFHHSTSHVETASHGRWGFRSVPPDAHSQTYSPRPGDQRHYDRRERRCRRRVPFPFPSPAEDCRRI